MDKLDKIKEGLFGNNEIKQMMDQMPGGFFVYQADQEERIIYANKAMRRILGCDTFEEFQELTGGTFCGLVHPEDLDEVEESIQEQIAHSQYDLDYVEYRIIRKDGQVRWIEDYGHFIRSDTMGDVFYVFAGDATEKRKALQERQERLVYEKEQKEEELQRQTREYNKKLNFINQEQLRRLEVIEGLSISYESILYVNLETDKILPYRMGSRTERQFEGKLQPRPFGWFSVDYVKTWVCPEDQAMVIRAIDPVYMQQKLADSKSYYVNFRAVKDGEQQYLQLRIAGVGDERPVSRIVLGCRRVDEEVRHEMEQKKVFEDALNHARMANVTKNTFLANMSHDMRTPLNAINGFTALAKTHIDHPEILSEYLDGIETAGTQLLHLINDVLEISRIESGTMQAEDIPCSLRDIAENVQETVGISAGKKGIRFSVDLSGLTHADVYSDSQKLRQILFCLTNNGVKFTDGGGWVRLTVTEEKDPASNHAVYRFIVEDNGKGISQELQECIFEPFERGGASMTGEVQGTGLGLTIVKNFVEMMSGDLDLYSVPGEGSRFTVTLRLRIQSSQAMEPEKLGQALIQAMGSRKLLLVDDNQINLEIETELLEEAGFQVETAENGLEAVNKLQAVPDRYGLVLMDIQMPVMNGYEAARAIRSMDDPACSGIPIIALSANAFEEDRYQSRESGMNAHMAKPADIPKLMELMGQVLRVGEDLEP